ncbi:hypothetical protein AB0F45_18760, partial [Streptomyces achromogenes]|uniref:hypothetical protein n=1 Tax=Streptomyces achromogenes TaxID=67255 RepID=UPI003405C50C
MSDNASGYNLIHDTVDNGQPSTSLRAAERPTVDAVVHETQLGSDDSSKVFSLDPIREEDSAIDDLEGGRRCLEGPEAASAFPSNGLRDAPRVVAGAFWYSAPSRIWRYHSRPPSVPRRERTRI